MPSLVGLLIQGEILREDVAGRLYEMAEEVGHRVERVTGEVAAEFAAIRARLQEMFDNRGHGAAAAWGLLEELTRSWSSAMQRLSAVSAFYGPRPKIGISPCRC